MKSSTVMRERRFGAAKKWLLYALFSYILLALQLTAMPYVRVLGITPWLPPIILACILTFQKAPATLVYAAVLGTWSDAFMRSGPVFAITFSTLALIAWRIEDRLPQNNIAKSILFASCISAISQLVYSIIFLLAPGRADFSLIWTHIPIELALSLFCLIFVYPLFRRICSCQR